MSKVTTILLNWRRPENMALIIDSLKTQSEPPELLLVNNGGYHTFGIKRVVSIPWNGHAWIRYPFAVYAETPYVMFLDDDLMPADRFFVRDMQRLTETYRDSIVGTHGRRISSGPNYYTGGQDAAGWVEIVKGRCMMMDKSILGRVTLANINRPWPVDHEDIYLSMEIGCGQAIHWADDALRKRVIQLQEPHALSKLPLYWQQRDEAVAWHKEKIHLTPILAAAESIPHLCTQAELIHLWRCAMKAPEDLPMVELGCYQGSSSVMICAAAMSRGGDVTLIDRFAYGTQAYGPSSIELVQAHLKAVGVPVLPRVVGSSSLVVPDGLEQVGFLHIDTDHRRGYLYQELDVWEPRMAPGGVIAFHDYCDNSPEMIPAIDDWAAAHPEWKCLGRARWMIGYQKEAGNG